MNFKDVTVISIVGKRNVGKTTLIRELIPKLKEYGHKVGTLKYNIREFEIDHESKDTYKYFHSGADTVALSSCGEIAVRKRFKNSPQISEIIEKYFNDVSIILVEGYRAKGYPRIRIVDSQELKTGRKGSNNELLLTNENLKTEQFSTKNVNKALRFIENIRSRNKIHSKKYLKNI